MRVSSIATVAMLAGAIAIGSAGFASAQSCGELWYARNSIYKEFGYCFKTQRAIATFGNAGCMYDSEYELPMPPAARAEIGRIVRLESEFRCRY
jgi:hypothetical protein